MHHAANMNVHRTNAACFLMLLITMPSTAGLHQTGRHSEAWHSLDVGREVRARLQREDDLRQVCRCAKTHCTLCQHLLLCITIN